MVGAVSILFEVCLEFDTPNYAVKDFFISVSILFEVCLEFDKIKGAC